MKKISLILTVLLIFLLAVTQIAYGNMAAPKETDIGSAITFEQNDTISVLSEVLDIVVKGSKANIHATYKLTKTGGKIFSVL